MARLPNFWYTSEYSGCEAYRVAEYESDKTYRGKYTIDQFVNVENPDSQQDDEVWKENFHRLALHAQFYDAGDKHGVPEIKHQSRISFLGNVALLLVDVVDLNENKVVDFNNALPTLMLGIRDLAALVYSNTRTMTEESAI
jgi:hypothetical protein